MSERVILFQIFSDCVPILSQIKSGQPRIQNITDDKGGIRQNKIDEHYKNGIQSEPVFHCKAEQLPAEITGKHCGYIEKQKQQKP